MTNCLQRLSIVSNRILTEVAEIKPSGPEFPVGHAQAFPEAGENINTQRVAAK